MKILDFPKLRQTYEYDCGTKAIQSVLAYYGIEQNEGDLIRIAATNDRIGTEIGGMIRLIEKYGLKHDSGIMSLQDVEGYIERNVPVLILLQAWNPNIKDYSNDYNDNHWVVAIGYSKTKIYFEDPYSFVTTELTRKEMMSRWHAKENGKIIMNHGIAVYGKKPRYSSKKIIHMD